MTAAARSEKKKKKIKIFRKQYEYFNASNSKIFEITIVKLTGREMRSFGLGKISRSFSIFYLLVQYFPSILSLPNVDQLVFITVFPIKWEIAI